MNASPHSILTTYRPNPDWFDVREFVPPNVFALRGERAWELLDPRILLTANQLRERFGPVKVNDWHRGGHFKYSGFRDPACLIGARLSQHRFGRALDMKFRDASPREVFRYILENRSEFPYITTIEDVEHTPTWVHVDCRNNAEEGIRVIRP